MEDIALNIEDKESHLSNNDDLCLDKSELVISLDKFEGPIDVLLDLARKQKVDLKDISIVDLADQYIKFVNNAKNLNLELAAEYLVMAAWLAYLKSKILMPENDEEELSGEELSDALAFQLQKLNAMREVGNKLMQLKLLSRDRLVRGMPDKEKIKIHFQENTSLNDMLLAYTSILRNKESSEYALTYDKLETVESALIRLNKMLGGTKSWEQLSMFLPENMLTDDEVITLKNALNNFRNEFIGFVHQFFYLIPELSVIENVALPKMIMGKYNQSKT